MTLRKHFENLLYQHALTEDQIKAIMDAVEADKANECMKARWTDHTEGYDQGLLNGLWVSVCRNAVEWIDANKPLHFMRAAFARVSGG